MREMKNSGVAWIGDIPENWEVLRNKNLIYEINEKCTDTTDLPLLSVSEYYGVAPRADKIHDGQIVSRAETFEGYKICHQDDVVMNIMLAWKRAQAVSSFNGIVSPAYCVYRKKNNSKLDMTFFNYLIRSDLYISVFKRFSTGIIDSRLRLYPEKFLALHSHVPPTYEQHKIAKHLNKACNNIENLINNQEQQIEKLKQYKQSLITEVVTKGLNPDVPMKDSGIEWIGKIPNNWQTKKIKYVAKIIDDKYLKGEYNYIALENIESHSARFIKTDSVYDLVGTKMAYSDTVIFGKLRPYLAKVFLVKEITCVNNEFSVFKGLEVTNEYLKYFMLGSRFIDTVNASTYGTKMPRANIGFISNLQITIPPFQEQQNIANYLDDKCAKIDRLIAIKQEKIDKLNDYKKSLIYEYVTGKREVC